MNRLIRKDMKQLKKTASYSINLHRILLDSGDMIEFEARIIANQVWYTIVQEHQFCSSSFYNGNDFDKAMKMYIEIVTAFKGIAMAEDVSKRKSDFLNKANQLVSEEKEYKSMEQHTIIHRRPLFLGNNDF